MGPALRRELGDKNESEIKEVVGDDEGKKSLLFTILENDLDCSEARHGEVDETTSDAEHEGTNLGRRELFVVVELIANRLIARNNVKLMFVFRPFLC